MPSERLLAEMACVFPLSSSAMDTLTAMIRVMRDGECLPHADAGLNDTLADADGGAAAYDGIADAQN